MELVVEKAEYPYKLIVLMSIMLVFLFSVLIWAIVCWSKIFAKFRFKEKVLIISISCVVISLVSQMASTSLITIYAIYYSEDVDGKELDKMLKL